MKYYSDKTKELYGTETELLNAEYDFDKAQEAKQEEERKAKEAIEAKKAARKVRAEEIEKARKEMVEAQKKYRKLIEEFCKDYGTYHYSTSSYDGLPQLFEDFLSIL